MALLARNVFGAFKKRALRPNIGPVPSLDSDSGHCPGPLGPILVPILGPDFNFILCPNPGLWVLVTIENSPSHARGEPDQVPSS